MNPENTAYQLSDLEIFGVEYLLDRVTPDGWEYCSKQRAFISPDSNFELWLTNRSGPTTLVWSAGGRHCICELSTNSWSYQIGQNDDETLSSFVQAGYAAMQRALASAQQMVGVKGMCCFSAPLNNPK